MSDTKTHGKKGNGITYRLSNPPNKNGAGPAWENFGNLFIDVRHVHGTVYLDVTVEQLQALIATAKDGKVKKNIGLHLHKPRNGAVPKAPAASA